MSEKVKVTVKQKEAIDRLNEYQLEQIKDFKKNPEKYADWVSPLNELPEKKIIDALYIGYEVEPEFKVNDPVIFRGELLYITAVQANSCNISNKHLNYCNIDIKEIRHATPSEIAEEKERRTEKKLDKLLLDLTDQERVKLHNKLVVGLDMTIDE